jgi:flagellar basal body-associated protein FliL
MERRQEAPMKSGGRNRSLLVTIIVVAAIMIALVAGALIIRWELKQDVPDRQAETVRQINDDQMFWTLQLM